MPKKKDRIIIDTNLWISFLLTKNIDALDKKINDKLLILLFSQTLLDEFTEVARRPKFTRYFSLGELEILLMYIGNTAKFINVTSNICICRDPKDNFLLSLAKDGNATHLITGDNDLLEIKMFEKTRIVTMSEYLFKTKTSR